MKIVRFTYCVLFPQEELDEVFNQLRQKPDEPGKLATNWPPPRNRDDVDDHRGPENGGYSADHHFGGRFDDVVLELQLPERIVCRTCAEVTTGQCVFKRIVFFS